MIANAIKDTLNALGADAYYYLTLQFLDQFWWYFAALIVIFLVIGVICYFFGNYFPVLRPIGGVILLVLSFGLFSYSRGERDARARQPKPKPPQPRTDRPWF